MTSDISTDLVFFILKDKACEELDGVRHQEPEEGGDDPVSDTEEKKLREEAVYEKEMVSLQIEILES
jgi:hypothetical protein